LRRVVFITNTEAKEQKNYLEDEEDLDEDEDAVVEHGEIL
jgi:hypothetical protein